MNLNNLIIEVTRKCNLSCDHCLRGEAINVNQKKEYINSLLSQVDNNINSICFTGGEPSLNVPIMEYFLEQVKIRRISIGSFYIATNGVKPREDFAFFCLKLFAYCDEKDQCQLQVSNDMYHGAEESYDIDLLSGLVFFTKKFEKDSYNYGNGAGLIKEGRSTYGHKVICIDDEMTLEKFEEECEIYLNCKGEIINGCNWSYTSQKKHKLCNVGDLDLYVKNLEMIEIGIE